MVFDIAENMNINSVLATLPKNSLCLGQIKIHISSINDNRHPYNKGLIILPIKIVVLIDRHCDPTFGNYFRPCYTPRMVAVVPVDEDSRNDKILSEGDPADSLYYSMY